jgi:aminoglycoside phosphotransferase
VIDDGRCRGHVDFGSLGVADRWADLATGAEFFAACGVGLRQHLR